jgi:hypothetical protein
MEDNQMKRLSFFALCLTLAFGLFNAAPGQQLLQESFENPPGAGYSIDPDTFCTWTTSDYFGRYTVDTAPSGLSVGLGNIDGDYFIAGEDMDSYNPPDTCCLPTDATYIITLDALDITGYTDLHVTIAVNAKDALKYDAADYLKILQCVDGGDTVLIGQFTTMGGTNNKLGLDTDLDGVGDIEISDYANLTDYTFDVGETGTSLVVLLIVRFDSGDEEIVFDNVRVIEGIIDTEPPELMSATAVSETQVDAFFNEDVEETSAETPGNYTISGSITVSAADRDVTNNALVHLTVSPLTSWVTYVLTANNVEDMNGNVMTDADTVEFMYQVQIGYVTITEFMPNPAAVADAAGEWFEIYNNMDCSIDLTNWVLKDNFGADTIEGPATINSGEYFVFCNNETLATNGGVPVDYQYVQNVYPSNWGLALANSDDEIVILDNLGRVQDSVDYDNSWVYASGASAQLIDINLDNDDPSNWCVAQIPWSGSAGDFGTPGEETNCEPPPPPCLWLDYFSQHICLSFEEGDTIEACWCCPYGTEEWMQPVFSWMPGCEWQVPGCDTTCPPITDGLFWDVAWVVPDSAECVDYPGVGYWTTRFYLAPGDWGCVCLHWEDQLPVELATFEAVPGDGKVTLNWSTASETNNDHFDIARRTSQGGDWTKIGEEPGTGSTATESHYSFVDENVTNGVTYDYQLTAVDFNGDREVQSSIASATPSSDAVIVTDYALYACYPNPFNAVTEIRYDVYENGHVRLEIFDLLGRKVASLVDFEQSPNRYAVRFDASNLPTGVYLYRLQVNDFTATKKMMLLK